MRSFITVIAAVFAVASIQADVIADIYTDTRSNTEDIVIPAFNQSLGTLESVSLRVSMLSGTTSASGSHNHLPYQLLSTNQEFGSGSGNFAPFNVNTLAAGASNHSFVSSYAGGGLNLGSFNGTTSTTGNHTHLVQISSAGTETNGFFYRLRVNVNPFATGPHTHNYAGIVKNFNYVSAGQLSAFLGGSDLVIVDSPVSTSNTGSHTHNVGAFNVVSNGDGFSFAPSVTSGAPAHSHTLDPRWTVTATFTYSAIPEPASMFVPAALAAVAGLRRRR